MSHAVDHAHKANISLPVSIFFTVPVSQVLSVSTHIPLKDISISNIAAVEATTTYRRFLKTPSPVLHTNTSIT